MKIYVAASSQEIERARQVTQWLHEFSTRLEPGEELILTHDWVQIIDERGDANPVDAGFTERYQYAMADLVGVRNADVLWLLLPDAEKHSVGCYWEAGYADALGKDIIISGGEPLRSIFTTRGKYHDRDFAAFEAVKDAVFEEARQKRARYYEEEFDNELSQI